MADDEVVEALERLADEVEGERRRWAVSSTPGDDWEAEEMRR